jgi:hypothetical protein
LVDVKMAGHPHRASESAGGRKRPTVAFWTLAVVLAALVAGSFPTSVATAAVSNRALQPHYVGITTIANPGADIHPEQTPQDFFSTAYCSLGAVPDNGPSCTAASLDAINYAHLQQGLAPISLPSNWGGLNQAQQIVTVFNLERASYGLPPIYGLGSALDGDAMAGAMTGTDPSLVPPAGFVNGGSIWAGGYPNALAADFSWMWDDGWGGSPANTANGDCTSAGATGCWGHRQIILTQCQAQGVSSCKYVAGAAETSYTPPGLPAVRSFAAVMFSTTGALPALDYVYPDNLTIATTSLPGGSPGVAYSATAAAVGGVPPYTWALASGALPPGLSLNAENGNISGTPTALGSYAFTVAATDADIPAKTVEQVLSISVAPYSPHGYWLVAGDGGVFTFGRARFFGSTGTLRLQRPVVGMTVTDDRGGYWMVARDGGLFAFGDATYHGSIPGLGISPAGSGAHLSLNAPIVAMVASPTGKGYLLVGADGGVFAFGDARFHGSCPQIHGCSGSVVAVVPATGELGYWVVTSTGHVYAFGNAGYLGAPTLVSAPVTGAVPSASGRGYAMVDARGDVFAFGDIRSLGVPPGGISASIEGMVSTSSGNGYWLVSALGAVYAYGDAPNYGSMAGRPLNSNMVTADGF